MVERSREATCLYWRNTGATEGSPNRWTSRKRVVNRYRVDGAAGGRDDRKVSQRNDCGGIKEIRLGEGDLVRDAGRGRKRFNVVQKARLGRRRKKQRTAHECSS